MTALIKSKKRDCRSALERNIQISNSLRETLSALNSNRELEEILDFIVQQAKELLEADAVAIYTPVGKSDILEIVASLGLSTDYIEIARIPMGTLATGYATLTRQPAFISDVNLPSDRIELPLDEEREKILKKFSQQFRSLLAIPLVFTQGEVYGTLDLYFKTPHQFSEEEISLGKAYADQTILAIENARLRSRAKKAAAIAERDRLARDLHDTVTQTLFSISWIADILPLLTQNDPKGAQDAIMELKHLSRGALAEMRSLLFELRPTALLTVELEQLIQQLADAFRGQTKIDVNVEFHPLQWVIPADIKIAFYRIVQEALQNVKRHAHASLVNIYFGEIESSNYPINNLLPEEEQQRQRLRLVIQDNGSGFDSKVVSADHFGLNIIRERSVAIQAVLKIDSKPGTGTTIEVVW